MLIVTRNRVAFAVLGSALLMMSFAVNSAQVEAQQAKAENARIRTLLQERAVTLKEIADRIQQLQQAKLVRPEELFAAKSAAVFAAADAAENDAARVAMLQGMLTDTIAYERLIAESIRANPAEATDARGKIDRLNALAQMKVSRLDLELAIERLKAGGGR